MSTNGEAEVLLWFDRALDVAASDRGAWLASQALPGWLHARVARLLAAEADATGEGFLESAPRVPDAPDFPRAGDRLGNYALLRQIDAGGMGVVFLAARADESYQQQVAIKLIRPLHLVASPSFRRQLVERFENERRLLARLQHPNVARILDGGSTASGIPYIVMEYVDGVPLTDHCDATRADVRTRLRLFVKVCDGVQAAHAHLIVHRDLKPDNILVGADGEPRLLDFGIARALGDDALPVDGATALTAMTPAYASPEQVRHEALTTASDVYSLGVMLFVLLAGRRPYELAGLSPAQAERVVCDAVPPTLARALADAPIEARERQARRAALSEDLERIVARAMHKDPARRYASAQALAADVGRHLDGRPVHAHPDSPAYRTRKFLGRHPVGSVAATLALAAILASTVVAFSQAREARRAAEDMRDVNAFLSDVLKLSDPFDTHDELTLGEALDRAADGLDQRFAGRPDLSADIRFGIGYSMLSRYRLDAADEQLTRALDEATRAFGADDLRTLQALEGVAGLRQEQGRIAEAERLYRDTIARIESGPLRSHPLRVTALNNLGNLLLTQERYPEADAMLGRAVAAADPHADLPPADRAGLVSNQAQAVHGLGDLPRADVLYRQAQARYEAAFPRGTPDLAILLNNRALLAEDRGDLAGALVLHRASLDMRRRVFDGAHPMVAVALANVSRLEVASGDTAAALAHAREAVAMADAVYAEPNGRHASIHASLAEAEAAAGDAPAALRALRRADTIMATVDAPAPNAVAYLERVRTRLCTGGAVASAPCRPAPQ